MYDEQNSRTFYYTRTYIKSWDAYHNCKVITGNKSGPNKYITGVNVVIFHSSLKARSFDVLRD